MNQLRHQRDFGKHHSGTESIFSRYEVQRWMLDGLCADDEQPDDWFAGEKGPKGDESRLRSKRAKEVCGRCPVKERCLAFAVEASTTARSPLDGIWGGTTARQRRPAVRAYRDKNGRVRLA
jgi:WhiB family redox-sensing transcriptional regulator